MALIARTTIASALLLSVASAQRPQCGTLITYRQYSVLLDSAPKCFRDGCGNPPPADSMSSSCTTDSPCYPLWSYLRSDWQEDYCAHCSGDLACRLPGWPVLNATAACDTSPDRWLFSGTGNCCVNTEQEPFALADWISTICNASEPWRAPFAYYGGMAMEDWEEYIEPWNWTLGLNYTDRSTPPVSCTSAVDLFVVFFQENATSLGSYIAAILGFYLLIVFGHPLLHLQDHYVEKKASRALLYGLGAGGAWIMGNFLSALVWQRYAGFESTPLGELGLLLCSRPSAVGFLCIINMSGPRLLFHSPLRQMAQQHRDLRLHMTNTWLAYWGFRLAVAEFIVQMSGCAIFFIASISAGRKGLLIAGNLSPFWRGDEALIMYRGALVHVIFFFPASFLLLISTFFHARKIKLDRVSRNKIYVISYLLPLLDKHFERLEADQLANRRPSARERRLRIQRLEELERRMGTTRAIAAQRSLRRRLWARARTFFRNQPRQDQQPPAAPTADTTPLRQDVTPAEAFSHPTKPATATTNDGATTDPQQLNRLQRLAIATINTVLIPFRLSLSRSTSQLYDRLLFGPEQGPEQDIRTDRALWTIRRREAELWAASLGEEDVSDGLDGLIFGTFLLTIVNYISQWLFWAGFVRSMAYR
jgi:hypothetical protein